MIILKIGHETYAIEDLDDAFEVMNIMKDAKKADYGYGTGDYTVISDSSVKIEVICQPDKVPTSANVEVEAETEVENAIC